MFHNFWAVMAVTITIILVATENKSGAGSEAVLNVIIIYYLCWIRQEATKLVNKDT